MREVTNNIQVQQVHDSLLANFSSLLDDSIIDGHKHIQRLIDDYISGENRFDKSGESLFAALFDNMIIGICGLNQYVDNDLTYGRIRRLYVKRNYRRFGLGKMLVEAVIKQTNGKFKKLVLKTDSPVASKFYKTIGFRETASILNTTHIKDFAKNQSKC